MSAIAAPGVLADRWSGGLVRSAVLVTVGAAATGVAAQVSIPLPGTPVPLTLQTLAVLLAGAALGRTLGALSMLLYVGAGLVGVPWFAGQTSGFHPATLGYLIGFIVAAWFTGRLAAQGRDRKFRSAAGLMVIGNLVIYAFGVPILALTLGVSLQQALMLGVVPFLIGDAIKVFAAAGLLPAAWALANKGGE
jgi:biotin transport system substrate-specific component